MIGVALLLLILAAVCFLFAALPFAQTPRVNVTALGLFFWVLSQLIR